MTLAEQLDEFRYLVVNEALTRNKHNLAKTATELGISRKSLWELRKKYGIPARQVPAAAQRQVIYEGRGRFIDG